MYPLRFHPFQRLRSVLRNLLFLSSTGNNNPVEREKDNYFEVVIMAARLTDRQKKKILADYVQTNNYCATAKTNGVSATTVKNIVLANAEIVGKCEQKKEENTADVLAYMDAHKDLVCSFIGKGLELLNDPDKLKAANLSQITTAMGTLIDKWAMVQEKAGNDDKDPVRVIIDV